MKTDNNNSRSPLYQRLEDVIGCKWSVSVLVAVREGTVRPGALERHISGISTKVLSERLRKLVQYGLLSKTTFPEAPPRTEYSLTPTGRELIKIIGQIQKLDEKHKRAEQAADIRWRRRGAPANQRLELSVLRRASSPRTAAQPQPVRWKRNDC